MKTKNVTVKELIERLKKIQNQYAIVQLLDWEAGKTTNFHGIVECEEDTSIMLCDHETFLTFME